MIKVGEFLVCKKDYTFERFTYFVKDRPYEIKVKYGSTISVSDIGILFCLDESNECAYVWDWFYTPAEFRDKQINSILSDD